MLIDLTQQFKSYCDNSPITQSAPWNQSQFIKTSQNILVDMQSLTNKMTQLEQFVKISSRFKKQQQSKRFLNIKQSIKMIEQSIKRLGALSPDIKCRDPKIINQLKNSILATLEMRFLSISIKLKDILIQARKSKQPQQSSVEQQQRINLNRAHFLGQSQQQIMSQVAVNQYKQIQKSITQISQMYTQTLSVLKMHEHMIERIVSNIDETQQNVDGGNRNLGDIQRKQQKNRAIIIKLFIVLYIIVFVYIVVLS